MCLCEGELKGKCVTSGFRPCLFNMAAGAEDSDRNPDTTVREHICFLCKDSCLSKDKIKVFGRSSLEISALIARATKVDLSVYAASDREKAVICNSTCYKRLIKYQNVVRKLDAIVTEIQRDFHGGGSSRGKRLASKQNGPLDANKKIKLENLLTSSSGSPRETLHQAPSTLQIGGKSNSCTEATVHVVYAIPNSINTALNAGSSVSTFARPSPILAADNTATNPGISVTFARPPSLAFAKGVNTAAKPGICFTTAFTQLSSLLATATQPGISLTTFARPSPALPGTSSVNTTTQPGISLTTFARPSPISAMRNTVTKPAVSATTFTRPSLVVATTCSVNTATRPGISTTTSSGPSPALAAANSVITAIQSGISLGAFTRSSPVLAAANSVNTATKPGFSVTTLDRPPISTAAKSVSIATKPGISVTALDRPISTAANSVSIATKPGISVTALDRPISTTAKSVSIATKPGISVTALDRPISTTANCVSIATKSGISVTALDRPIPATANIVNTTTKPVSSGFFSNPLRSFTTDQLFAVLPLQAQKPEEKQEIRIRICVDYPSKPVRKELKSELHVLAKAMVDGNHQRIAGAALKIDGVKELVIEKVIKLMTLQVDELCSKHRPSMLRPTSRNTNDEAKDFDYKKLCSEWKERAPIFHAFLTACAAIKRSRKKNSPECLPGVAVAGTVLLKQRNTQMNAGFAKILGFLIRSKSLEKLADLSNKIQRIEIMMSILEAKLASIPGLEDVTVSTPAPSGAAAAPAAGPAPPPPPASDVPQTVTEAQGPHAPPAEEPEPEKPTMTVSKDPRYAKYFQMVKVGVPLMAIAPKMKAEGLDPSYIENPDAPAPDGATPPPGQSDSDEDMSSTSSFSDED